MLTQGSNHSSRLFAGHLDQHGKARMTFYQGRHVAVLGPAQQIAFSMTRNHPVVHFCGPFSDGDASTI